MKEIPAPNLQSVSPVHVQFGKVIPAQQQILLYNFSDWEDFVHEWVNSQRSKYLQVLRMSGPNDKGIDVAGYTDKEGLHGVWDNFQCKHYKDALTPATAIIEIGKILWYSYSGDFRAPRYHYFIAPKGCGMSLVRLLGDRVALATKTINEWDKCCAEKITNIHKINLEGEFKKYVENFDFSIFSHKTLLEIIDDHKFTQYHAARFGGGLQPRPPAIEPPESLQSNESHYIQQLYEVYEEKTKARISEKCHLETYPDLLKHFSRQREFFYHAESLRNFARDNVPPGTYEDLQTEVYAGVIDIHDFTHNNSFSRLGAVLQAASSLQLTSNALISVIKVQDRKGICHQLANDNRLEWRQK